MKKLLRVAIAGCSILLATLLSGCKPTPVTPQKSCVLQTATEPSVGSTYLASTGQLFAIFNFSQAVNSYSDITCGQTTYGATSLSITNVTNLPVSFNYIITMTVGIVTWQYQGAVAIAANSSTDVGVINSTNAQRIHLGTVNIQLSNVVF